MYSTKVMFLEVELDVGCVGFDCAEELPKVSVKSS